MMGGVVQSATDLKDFADAGYDHATNKVQGVVLVDTTTTNTDMVGTTGVDTGTHAALVNLIWNELTAEARTAASYGQLLKDNIDAVLSAIETDTQNIQTRLPAALIGGAMDSDVSVMQAAVIVAATFAAGAVDAAALATDGVQEIRDAILPTQNAAFNFKFTMVAASDDVTPVTGMTGGAVTRSIDGGAFAAAGGTLTEVANGVYRFAANAADMNGGEVAFRIVGTGGTPGAPNDTFVYITTTGGV